VTELPDGEARRRIATEFDATFFVEAAAGTGKTTALVRRIVGVISAGVGTLDRIVAVTFTEKAAGEKKLNLRSEIEAARAKAGPEQRARLDRALEELELARIGTSCKGATRIFSSTSSRIPIRSRWRSCCCSRRMTLPPGTGGTHARFQGSCFWSGIRSNRFTGFDEPTSRSMREVKARLIRAGAELLHLTTSFRAPPSIQSFVNAAFSRAMTASPDRGQAAYVALEKSRPEIQGQPKLVALPVPRPYSDYGRFAKYQVDESFPPAVGAFIHWLTNESGWSVEEDGDLTPIRPRHIAILFRRFRNFGGDAHRPQSPSNRPDHHDASDSRAGACRVCALADRRAGPRQYPKTSQKYLKFSD
jgi:ATP-dependent exoDNAse (exonuclease V) beta subunit